MFPSVETDHRALLVGPLAGPTWTLCLGVGLHALTWFMVAAALPATVAELGGVALISWATTLYLVASILTGSCGGRLKARFGARRTMLAATGVFTAGSLLAGAATSMGPVLIGRTLQGLGEGAILALSYALVRTLFPDRMVPRAFGLLAVVYALAALLGPVLAGVLTDAFSWRLAFLINLPLAGILATLVIGTLPAETNTSTKQTIPLDRVGLLGAGILLVGLAGHLPQALPAAAVLLAAGLLLAATIRHDRRSARRLLPAAAFTSRHPVGLGLWMVLLLPLAAAGVHVYVPLLMHGQHGFSSTAAGYFVALTALAWSAAAYAVGRVEAVHFARRALVIGPLLIAAGLVLTMLGLLLAGPGWAALGLLSVGSGFGTCWAFLSQRIIHHAALGEEDATAGLIPTVQSAGGALGAATAGVGGNLAGFRDGVMGDITTPVLVVFGIGTLAALAALALAPRLRRLAG